MFIILIFSLVVSAIYSSKLRQSIAGANTLRSFVGAANPRLAGDRVSVIIPAYNEADNIHSCAIAVLNSTPLLEPPLSQEGISSDLPSPQVEVLVVDDQSTDETYALADYLQQNNGTERLKVIAGQTRPAGDTWVGKNWACTQGAELAQGEFLLFIDADVRLKEGAIEKVIQIAQQEQIDLLSCAPALVCECWAEWLVQPVMFNHLAVCFDFACVSDRNSETTFASGQFMLFRRSAYDKIGGHRAVAGEVVEDVELARRVKQAGLKLQYAPRPDIASVRMYRSWGALWEGWTKNLYLGAQRSVWLMVYLAFIMVMVYPVPWLGLALFLGKCFFSNLNLLDFLTIGLSLIGIWLQYNLRVEGAKISQCPPKYWWLSGMGGALVAAIALASVIKTETGWGWTWRGRELKLPAVKEL
ncbi:glycosyltransferase [Microcoleus sp. FACHB-831]|nr:glycosyltransferase [Microcoleus sp. FACHB-831]